MPTVQQLASKQNIEVIEGLKKCALAVPADKRDWKPLELGRTVVNQVAECALITGYIAKTIAAQSLPEFDKDGFETAQAGLDTLDKAIAALDASANDLKAAIDGFPTNELDTTLAMPWFETPQTYADIMFIAYWNNTYHIGQINYIQTLYGDNVSH